MSPDGSNNNTSRELSESGRRALDWWFQLDTWKRREAACLMCGIDFRVAKINWGALTMKRDGYHGLIQSPSLDAFLYEDWDSCVNRCMKAEVDDHFGPTSDKNFGLTEYDHARIEVAEYISDIEENLRDVCVRLTRAIDLKTDENASLPPISYLDWAKTNGIDIPWLDWADDSGYLVEESRSPRPDTNKPPEVPTEKTPSSEALERQEENERQIAELRDSANMIAAKLKKDGIHQKHITVERICKDLVKESFSNGESFTSRWRTVDGMRSYLKGENHPKNSDEYKSAKSTRGKFHP